MAKGPKVRSDLGKCVKLPKWKTPAATIAAIKLCASAQKVSPGRLLEKLFDGWVDVADIEKCH
jgi:hypothetical protein